MSTFGIRIGTTQRGKNDFGNLLDWVNHTRELRQRKGTQRTKMQERLLQRKTPCLREHSGKQERQTSRREELSLSTTEVPVTHDELTQSSWAGLRKFFHSPFVLTTPQTLNTLRKNREQRSFTTFLTLSFYPWIEELPINFRSCSSCYSSAF